MKKGFTLVELIVVIVLLGLISIFTFPSINKTIKNRKEALYNIQVDNIKASALSYVNKYDLLKESDKVIITLCQLKQNGFEDEKLKNPINNELIPDDSKVVVTKNEDETIYDFIYGTKGNAVCTRNDTTLFEYVEIGSNYNEKIDTTLYDVTIYSGNDVVSRVDTSKLGTYYIEYVSGTNKIDKYVYIVDTTGPNIEYTNLVNGSKVIGKSLIEEEAKQSNLFDPYSVVVTDNSGEEISAVISTNINLKIVGTYYITYKATDSSGNSTVKTQAIKVVDTKSPIIFSIDGNPTSKTSMSAVIYVNAYDDGVGLNPLGAYSFDGGKTWQVDNSITVDSNQTLNIAVRDAALNVTKRKEVINNILKDDKNISFTVTSGTLKNNGWYTSDVKVLVKPLVASEYFDSFKYCVANNTSNTSNTSCNPDKSSSNYNGEVVSINENTNNTIICGKVIKKDGTSTNTICSVNFKIDKSIPNVTYKFESGRQNSGYEPWYVSNVVLAAESDATSGIEKIKYCTTTGNSCTPNKKIIGSSIDISLSRQSRANKVCGIVTNKAGTESSLICSISYAIDKTVPNVVISVTGSVDGYVGKSSTLKANVTPSYTISGYSYVWYKNGQVINGSNSDTLVLNYGDNISRTDNYSVTVTTGAGNKGNASKSLKVDTVKPSCSLTANGTSGSNGWFISSSVSIVGSFRDNESGVGSRGIGKSKTYNESTTYTISSNTTGDTIYCYVKDKVGNENSNSITVKKDDGSNTTCTLKGENSSWTNNRVNVQYEMYNSVSGFAEDQTDMSNKISVYNDKKVDSGMYGLDSNNYYGLEAIFYSTGTYKTMSFSSWSATLNSGKTVSCGSKTANVYYDGDEPTCEITASGTLGNNNWYKSNVTMSITTSDGSGSGIDGYDVSTSTSASYNKTSSLPLSNGRHNVYGYVKDVAGNTNTCHYGEVKVDANTPTVTISGSVSSNTWTNSNITLTGNVSPATTPSDYTYAWYKGETKISSSTTLTVSSSGTYRLVVTTGAGNSGSASYIAKIDKTAPTCEIAASGTLGNNGWYKSGVTMSITTSDSGGSGIDGYDVTTSTSASYNKTSSLPLANGRHNVYGYVKDLAGNTNTCHYGEVKVDANTPTVTISGTVASNTWTNGDITLTGSVSPESTPSNYTYAWYKGETKLSSTSTTLTVTSSGTYRLVVTTGAGNSGSASYIAKIDKTAPTCGYSGENSTWTKNNVTISISCSDEEGGSGCKSGTGLSETITTSTNKKTLTTTIEDNAGNTANCSKEFTVKVDKAAPTCKVTDTSPTPITGNDGASGYVTISDTGGSGAKESRIVFSDLTANKSYTIYDNAGNSATCTVNVSKTTEYRYRTCTKYNSCRVAACGKDSCATGSNTCKPGYIESDVSGKVFICSTGASCKNPSINVAGCTKTNLSCTYKAKKPSDCATGSNTCKKGYKSCRNKECGCDTWTELGTWSTEKCYPEANVKDCKERTYYTAS